jgi:hypothetical protein
VLPPETSDIRSGDRLQDFGRRGLRTGLAFASLLAVAAWSFFLANRTPGDRSALVGFPLDDAWIHLVYARSLVTEGGFHFNAGVPEAGMTSPLWVIFAASVHLVAAPFGTAAVVISTKAASLEFRVGEWRCLEPGSVGQGRAQPGGAYP